MESINLWAIRRMQKLGLSVADVSAASGASGGICSVWNPNFFKKNTGIIRKSWIMSQGHLVQGNGEIRFVNVYAPNDPNERKMVFDEISEALDGSNIPTIIGGDFNCVLKTEERCGGPSSNSHMKTLSEFQQRNGLIDLPMQGGSYTWFKGNQNIASKLDRFFISPEILQQMPSLEQNVLLRGISDHCPVVLKQITLRRSNRTFKWFNNWAFDDEYKRLIKETCATVENGDIGHCFKKVKVVTKAWAIKKKKENSDSITDLEKKISDLESSAISNQANNNAWEEIKILRIKLWQMYIKAERDWLQKSRLRWFKEGDRNTAFFHVSASLRQKRNSISSLETEGGKIVEPKLILSAFEDHFKKQFNSSRTLPLLDLGIQLPKLSSEAVIYLEKPFEENEVWDIIKHSDGNRAPGPDGFNWNFFKHFLPQVKPYVMNFMSNLFEGRPIDKSFNESFIALIPKTDNPVKMEEFRPISLVSSVYKIAAKLLANRLGNVIGEIIGEKQFAFVKGRQILDCALIANELIHDMQHRKKRAVILKADFNKAYDSIDWLFLDKVMDNMGFGTKWRKWINWCISSPTVSILVNGTPSNKFKIKRGLRQGCPLSPLLFNLVGEALSGYIRKAEDLNLLAGVKIGRSEIKVSHIQFADDLIMFMDAEEKFVLNAKRILRIFEVMSGLKLNAKKTRLFGLNVETEAVKNWASNNNWCWGTLPTVYLGLPLGHKRNNKDIWKPIIDKMEKKLAGWKVLSCVVLDSFNRLCSPSGGEVDIWVEGFRKLERIKTQ
ncbi:hypothetical protein HRI_002709100 [Hibiscus trionum]|uniref:Reverse transcriptase domain-containing protein n=1 Tax=Hibiscus trionum TaxID=183268 RepID=A0A9W7I9H6_HIBTR|nr:hypothetical protein HRI_002709100 [Hibiscus trionum]